MEQYDHYEEAEKLVRDLKKEGLNHFADDIMSAMEEGATGTEIFMALRWNIKKLLNDNRCVYSENIKNRAVLLFSELSKTLEES